LLRSNVFNQRLRTNTGIVYASSATNFVAAE
jgi:hypothetical protein